MMQKPIIYLDMDGVLFDFVAAFGVALGIDDIKDRLQPGTLEIAPQLGLTLDELWKKIGPQGHLFWQEMPRFPWIDELIELVDEASSEWYILSSPARSSDSLKGKLEALKQIFGQRFRGYIFTPHKRLLAGDNRILIDDQQRQCDEFEMNGGRAILFPGQSNHLHAQADKPLDLVRFMLAELAKENLIE